MMVAQTRLAEVEGEEMLRLGNMLWRYSQIRPADSLDVGCESLRWQKVSLGILAWKTVGMAHWGHRAEEDQD